MSRYVPKVKYQLPNQHGKCCTLAVPEQLATFLDDMSEERRVIRQKAFPTKVESVIHTKAAKGVAEERSEWSIITTSSVDVDFESIDPKGAIWSRFQSGLPSVFVGHDYSRDCFLKCRQWKPLIDGWKAQTVYPLMPKSWNPSVLWEPDKYWSLVTEVGTMVGKSIGYLALEDGPPTQQEIDEQPELENCINRVRSFLVLEYSLTGIPMNGDCHVIEAGEPEPVKAKKAVTFHDVIRKSVEPELQFARLLKKCLRDAK